MKNSTTISFIIVTFLLAPVSCYGFELPNPGTIMQINNNRDVSSIVNNHKSKMQSSLNDLDQLQSILESDLNEMKNHVEEAKIKYDEANKNYKFVKSELKSVKSAKNKIKKSIDKSVNSWL